MKTETSPPKWTREPLKVGKVKPCFAFSDSGPFAVLTQGQGGSEQDLARAVACWNALLPIESPEDFVREVREHCESVLKWWEKARFITTSDSEGEEYNVFDDEPKFVTEARRLLSLLNGETKDER